MTDRVSAASLDWALKHVQVFGDTDVLPRPVEFDAIASDWRAMRETLARIDLQNHSIGAPFRTLTPKPSGTFRAAVQPDPLDSLLYLAMIYEIAEDLERIRVPASQRVACAYRLEPTTTGGLYRSESGWTDFHTRSTELASDGGWSHVITADIAGFFSHIYQHRLEAELQRASVRPERVVSLKRLLSQFTAKQSIGLPIGPLASFALAELLMNDVDRFLLGRPGVVHVRYVDDFRVFCNSYRTARRVLHDLSEYLYSEHRLTFATDKTRIYSVASFATNILHNPDEAIRPEEDRAASDLLDEFAGMNPYEASADINDLSEAALTEVQETALVRLFQRSMDSSPRGIGTAKFLLRRAAALRTDVLVPDVSMRLNHLVSVLPSVERYLRSTRVPRGKGASLRRALRTLATTSSWADIPHVRVWVCEMLRTCAKLGTPEALMTIVEALSPAASIRSTVLLAQRVDAVHVVRRHKEGWRELADWDRRALIVSGSILPLGERRPWLEHVRTSARGLDRLMASHVLASA